MEKNKMMDSAAVQRAIKESFVKLDPRIQIANPVMFLVYLSAVLTTILMALAFFGIEDAPFSFTLGITVMLWLTVLFANFAEAVAEGRGKAQADSLRSARKDVTAHLMSDESCRCARKR